MKLTVHNLSSGYHGRRILHDISFSIHTGEIVCLLGPNGSGKTTLFKTLLGLLPSKGGVYLGARELGRIDLHERARILAYIPQTHVPPFPFTVLDVVLTGRTSFIGMFSTPSEEDRYHACRALDLLNARHLVDRNYAQLSGGERQLILIARALAQSPKFLIMDEPTSHLDYGNQLRTIQTVRSLSRKDMGIIFTTHTPDHAFLCASRVLVLLNGSIAADGTPDEVLTPELLNRMYGFDIDILSLPGRGCVCAPMAGGVL